MNKYNLMIEITMKSKSWMYHLNIKKITIQVMKEQKIIILTIIVPF